MNTLDQIYFQDATQFRNWLDVNYNKSKGFWMLFYKKHTQKICINYSDALDEALCYGWIDSLMKRIDNNIYVRKFTPRKDINNWSQINKVRMKNLISQNRVKEAGLNKISPSVFKEIRERNIKLKTKPKLVIPEYVTKEFALDNKLLKKFNELSPGKKRGFVNWIDSAKKMETKNRRLREAIRLILDNKSLGMK